jgi:glutamine amidotransferase
MIDYGASNIRSAQKAFEAVGASVELTADPDIVLGARKLVLPGVGAFGAGIHALRERDLDSAVKTAVANGIPLLGICLGMQFLFEESDEMGQHEGLGLIPGHVTRFNFVGEENLGGSYKVPHMGWNQIEYDHAHPLLKDVPSGSHTYFVHSYYCVPTHKEDIVAITQYGLQFTSIVSRDNVHGIQFHPEKSQKRGLQLIKNYLEMN